MWTADKLIYRNQDNFIRAFQGDELVWERIPANNMIFYTSSDGNVVTPLSSNSRFGANIISNTYSNGLGVIEFDAPVTSVGIESFRDCIKLETIILPSSVTTIESYSFNGCTGLILITIPSSVTRIASAAFGGCSGLTSITIPSSVTSIGPNAFDRCTGLTSITIPSSVTFIDSSPFSACSGLTSITVDINNSVYDSRNDCNAIIKTSTNELISGCRMTVIPSTVTSIGREAFYGHTGLTSITIPSSVTDLDYSSFEGCKGLTSITIPSSVIKIKSWSFKLCTRLSEVIVNATTPPTLGADVFNNNASGRLIKVPAASLQAYKTASGWSDYASSIVAQ